PRGSNHSESCSHQKLLAHHQRTTAYSVDGLWVGLLCDAEDPLGSYHLLGARIRRRPDRACYRRESPVGLSRQKTSNRYLTMNSTKSIRPQIESLTAKAIYSLWLAISLLLCGCSTTKQKEIESVARDWSKTIRASQI